MTDYQIEPPKTADMRKIASIDEDIDETLAPLDIISQIFHKRAEEMGIYESEKNEEIEAEQARLAEKFSYDNEKVEDTEENLEEKSDLQRERDRLAEEIFHTGESE